jgi:hypothetical protein
VQIARRLCMSPPPLSRSDHDRVLATVYAAVVLALFKLKLVKPHPYPIAIAILAGLLMVGGMMVAWMQYAHPGIWLSASMSCSSCPTTSKGT